MNGSAIEKLAKVFKLGEATIYRVLNMAKHKQDNIIQESEG